MNTKNTFKVGQKFNIVRHFAFGKTGNEKVTIVAINDTRVLLDNGQEARVFNNNLFV